jgi:hypothetical protein
MINKTPNPPLIQQSDLPINAHSLKKLRKKSKKNSKSQNQSMVFGPPEGVRQLLSPSEQMQPANLERYGVPHFYQSETSEIDMSQVAYMIGLLDQKRQG